MLYMYIIFFISISFLKNTNRNKVTDQVTKIAYLAKEILINIFILLINLAYNLVLQNIMRMEIYAL
jgi:hypothetical protein